MAKLDDVTWHSPALPHEVALAYGGFVVAWLAQHDLLVEDADLSVADPGAVYQQFDGKLVVGMLDPDVVPTVSTYMEQSYADDFTAWLKLFAANRLEPNSWEAFALIAPALGQRLRPPHRSRASSLKKLAGPIPPAPEQLLRLLGQPPEVGQQLVQLATDRGWPRSGSDDCPAFDWAVVISDYLQFGSAGLLSHLADPDRRGMVAGVVGHPRFAWDAKTARLWVRELLEHSDDEGEGLLRVAEAVAARTEGAQLEERLQRALVAWAIDQAGEVGSKAAAMFLTQVLARFGEAENVVDLERFAEAHNLNKAHVSKVARALKSRR